MGQVEEFWKGLKEEKITVDVFVNNVAKFTEPKPLLELGADEVWSQMEVNAKSPLYFVEKFYKQGGEKQKASFPFFFFPTAARILTAWY
jgi:short-subunit dehydrogenase